jgi:beta/gamma crystallin
MYRQSSGKGKTLGAALAGALAVATATAMAGEITLYQGPAFQGHSMVTASTLPDLLRTDFNRTASSVVVRDGTWEACTQPNFTGVCAELVPGRYSNLGAQLNGGIMSARQVASRHDATHLVIAPDVVVTTEPQRAIVVATPPNDEPNVVLYQHTDAGIRAVELRSNAEDLGSRDFARRADAALVTGGIWRLCDAPRGRGQCVDYGPGQYVTLGAMDRRVVSAYLVSPSASSVSVVPSGRETSVAVAPSGRVTSVAVVPSARETSVAAVPPGRVVLYQHANFSGPTAVVRANSPDLDWARFSNPAESVRVESGTWLVCSDLGYQGECRVLGPGSYASIPGMTGVWSARQVWQPQYGSVDLRRVR